LSSLFALIELLNYSILSYIRDKYYNRNRASMKLYYYTKFQLPDNRYIYRLQKSFGGDKSDDKKGQIGIRPGKYPTYPRNTYIRLDCLNFPNQIAFGIFHRIRNERKYSEHLYRLQIIVLVKITLDMAFIEILSNTIFFIKI